MRRRGRGLPPAPRCQGQENEMANILHTHACPKVSLRSCSISFSYYMIGFCFFPQLYLGCSNNTRDVAEPSLRLGRRTHCMDRHRSNRWLHLTYIYILLRNGDRLSVTRIANVFPS